ncbi:MAG: type II toxin-antitoxin system VapC family toxin [Polyangiaceae bacterium]|nr:type II toxin-antitoxin system VapC family toxin [Polyangiaceae bacterium]
MIALLDTHILLWWFERASRLSAAQRRLLAKASDHVSVGVSDVTLLEIALLLEGGRVKLAVPLDEWLMRATAAPLVERCGISPTIAREIADLQATRDWDPADRVLVATARVLGVPLVTSDTRIINSGLVRVVQ